VFLSELLIFIQPLRLISVTKSDHDMKIQLSHLKINLPNAMAILALAAICTGGYAQNIAQWHGVNRDGQYNETSLLNKWKDGGPELLWATEGIGKGYAAPSVTQDKIFINGEIDTTSYLFAYDLKGKLLWKVENGKEFYGNGFSSQFPGARSTPTVVDDLVYSCSGRGRIICCDTKTGTLKWTLDMIRDMNGYETEFGIAESLLVDENKIYCNPGGPSTKVAALDRFTGKTLWTSEAFKDTTSLCSPILINYPARKILVAVSRHFLFALDCKNGETLWKYELKGYEAEGDHCNTPVHYKGSIYFVSGDRMGQGAFRLELTPDGTGIKEIWANPQIKNNFGSFIMLDDRLFTTIRGNYLKSLEINRGTVADSIKVSTGGLIFGDNKFICYGNNGDLSLITYDQGKMAVSSMFKVEKGTLQHFAHPVVANGIMYVRHGNALMAYKISR
jgi:outer membrane protein assembly factor BamB